MAHVTFIHGIANKPPADRLIAAWTRSLADADGVALGAEGVTSEMVYWADVLYEKPLEDASNESANDESAAESLTVEAPDLGIESMTPDEQRWVAILGTK